MLGCNAGSRKASGSPMRSSEARSWDRGVGPLHPSAVPLGAAALGRGHALGQSGFLQLSQSPKGSAKGLESFRPEGGPGSTDSAHCREEGGAIAFELNQRTSW